jgi:hypothetical protein
VVSNRVTMSRWLQPGQRSRVPDIGASPVAPIPLTDDLHPIYERLLRSDMTRRYRGTPYQTDGWSGCRAAARPGGPGYWTRRTVFAPDQWRSSW